MLNKIKTTNRDESRIKNKIKISIHNMNLYTIQSSSKHHRYNGTEKKIAYNIHQ
jgi:hypothetical protein